MKSTPSVVRGRGLAAFWTMLLIGATAVAQQDQPAAEVDPAATRQYAAAVALQNRDQFDLAADEWAKFLASFPQDPRAARGRHYLGVCRLKLGNWREAAAEFAAVIESHPRFEMLESSYLYRGIAQYNAAQSGDANDYETARKTFADLIKKFPKSEHLPQAVYYQGECLYAAGRKADAVRFYQHVADHYATDPLAPDALYALGVAQQELGEQSQAADAFRTFLAKHGQHRFAAEVTMRLGETLFADGAYAEAAAEFAKAAGAKDFALADQAAMREAASLYEQRQYAPAAARYSAIPTRFPQSTFHAAARLAGGKCAYLAGQFADARAVLAELLPAGGAEATEAAHWIARSHLKEGQPAQAVQVAQSQLPQATGEFTAQLALDEADALYELPDRRGDSVAVYAAVAEKYADDPVAPQAQYMAAFAAFGLNQFQPALEYSAEFAKRFADHALTPDVRFLAAESNLQLGRHQAAEAAFARLTTDFSSHDDIGQWHVRRALCLFLQNQFENTIAALTPVLPTLSNKDQLAEAHFLLGSSQRKLGRHEAAADALLASLAARPRWRRADETLLALAAALRSLEKDESARKVLERLLGEFPESTALAGAHYQLGELAYAQGDFERAETEYGLVLDRWPRSAVAVHALHGQGWARLSRQNAADAAQSFTRLLEQFGDSELAVRARYARALARRQLQEYSAAIDDLAAFLKTDPASAERSDALYVLGLCQVGLKQLSEAESTFKKILQENPDYAGADKTYYELAWTLKDQGKHEEAAAVFARLSAQSPDGALAAEAAYHIGERAYDEGEYEEAAKQYLTAIEAAETSELGEKAAHKLAWAYYRLDDFDRAREAFHRQRTTHADGPLAADAAFMEAECFFKQQAYPEALAAYEQLPKLADPRFQALALLHAGQAAAQMKEWRRGLALLKRCTQEFPDSEFLAEALYEQGWALQNLDQLDEAIERYELVTSKTDAEVAARARFMIGEICFERRQHGDAIRHFFRVAYGYGYPKWQAEALYEAGRCFEVRKQTKQALESYQEILDKHADSDKASLARKRITELGG